MILRRSTLAAALVGLIAAPALAGDVWSDLRPELYGKAVPAQTPGVVSLASPYRTYSDPRTTLGADVRAPMGEFITKVWLIIDENPMPVSAVFEMAEPVRDFRFSGAMRINGPTPVRVVVETDRGNLYMEEKFLKTSGVGACSAPPGTDPELALKTMGRMELDVVTGPEIEGLTASLTGGKGGQLNRAASRPALDGPTVELRMLHPSHSGMQMDQISLLYIPMRYVETIEVGADGKPWFRMTGSISMSEDPALRFSVPENAARIDVRMKDTDGATFEKSFPLISG